MPAETPDNGHDTALPPPHAQLHGTQPSPAQHLPAYGQAAPEYGPVPQAQAYAVQPHIVMYQKVPGTKKGLGITSMVLGISAVIFAWTTIFAFIMLVLAFVFGIASLVRKETPRGFAITGIILGSIAVVVVALIAVVLTAFGAAVMGGVSQ